MNKYKHIMNNTVLILLAIILLILLLMNLAIRTLKAGASLAGSDTELDLLRNNGLVIKSILNMSDEDKYFFKINYVNVSELRQLLTEIEVVFPVVKRYNDLSHSDGLKVIQSFKLVTISTETLAFKERYGTDVIYPSVLGEKVSNLIDESRILIDRLLSKNINDYSEDQKTKAKEILLRNDIE